MVESIYVRICLRAVATLVAGPAIIHWMMP